ncbi:xanthine dehydrogenase accessory protein XdhC [Roseovarius sp. EL26]|uniref:xanthine dehydrogenase accessory protein XdhC n=1 Tax=Roseovarius sp. EL26 TaxID=2126672 RepID=UPI000EA34BCB|nr:xanthine dehydrogenase accessory protein XdhC [Roseovarius sp. EL26]
MSDTATMLADFLRDQTPVIHIRLTRVRGSSPRNEGTEMFVTTRALWGTIGGGQLEYLVIEQAREMLSTGVLNKDMDVPLGPEIGQCCGGRVELSLHRMRTSDKRDAVAKADQNDIERPHVYVMGAGHVGRALANQFQHLPVQCVLIDTRPEEIALCTADVETRVSALPEVDIMSAPEGSAFIVLTHDHGLDFLLASTALGCGDAAYVGLIGSATKRIKFRNWAHEHCDGMTIDQLTCPIGAQGSQNKQPSVIAAFVVAEVMAELTSDAATSLPKKARKERAAGHLTNRKGISL